MKKKCKIILSILIVFLILFLTYIIYIAAALMNTPFRQTKDYNAVFIDNNLIKANYEIFLSPPDEYNVIEQINYDIRLKIANYMKSDALVLTDGEQIFCRRNNAGYEELLKDFSFEKESYENDNTMTKEAETQTVT